jgi:hypothetical protein
VVKVDLPRQQRKQGTCAAVQTHIKHAMPATNWAKLAYIYPAVCWYHAEVVLIWSCQGYAAASLTPAYMLISRHAAAECPSK